MRPDLPRTTTRAEWAAHYRANRAAARLFDRFRGRFTDKDGEPNLPSFYPAYDDFDPCRLHGDHLSYSSRYALHASFQDLKVRLMRTRYQPRLPR